MKQLPFVRFSKADVISVLDMQWHANLPADSPQYATEPIRQGDYV